MNTESTDDSEPDTPEDVATVQQPSEPVPESEFRISTLFRYLIGSRSAITTAARSRRTLLIGGLLVLSAGFAREYDGEDLLSEPWHLLIPHAASLATSIILYVMIAAPTAFWRGQWKEFREGYPVFLGLFWLTAPLAWIYAIPVERFLSAVDATRWNIYMLGIVSVWRVALIIRVIATVYRPPKVRWVVITVLTFGDAVLLVALSLLPVPVLQLMGGVRLTDTESFLQDIRFLLMLAGCPMLALLGSIYGCGLGRPRVIPNLPPTQSKHVRATRGLWFAVAASLLIWFAFLPFTQPPQQKLHAVERAINNRNFVAALEIMSANQPDDFPRHWSPPPHVGFPGQPCEISDIMSVIADRNTTGWARDVFAKKFKRKLRDVLNPYSGYRDPKIVPYLELMLRLPVDEWYDSERADYDEYEVLENLQRLLEGIKHDGGDPDVDANLSPHTKDLIRQILDRIGEPADDDDEQEKEQQQADKGPEDEPETGDGQE